MCGVLRWRGARTPYDEVVHRMPALLLVWLDTRLAHADARMARLVRFSSQVFDSSVKEPYSWFVSECSGGRRATSLLCVVTGPFCGCVIFCRYTSSDLAVPYGSYSSVYAAALPLSKEDMRGLRADAGDQLPGGHGAQLRGRLPIREVVYRP